MAKSVNIRDLSIKCGRCSEYQTLSAFARRGDVNVYTYECENEVCSPEATRTLVEVLAEIDEFARRDVDLNGSRHRLEDGGHEDKEESG